MAINRAGLNVPGPPRDQAGEALAEGVTLAATVSVTLTCAQAEALYDAARTIYDYRHWAGDAVKRLVGEDAYLPLLGAIGVLKAHLDGIATPPSAGEEETK